MSRAVEESNRRLLRARDAMDRTYAGVLDVPTLARIAHVSEAHFIRTFKATFGETPHRYLQRRRVLGLEVNTDQDLGFMRWLTVSVPGEPDHEILLERPGAPAHDPATEGQIRELSARERAAAGWRSAPTTSAGPTRS